MRRTLCAAVIALIATPCSGEVPALVSQAFDNMPPLAHSQWAFIRTGSIDGELRVEHYDPRCDSPWQLVSVDGQPPSAKALKKYAKKHKKAKRVDDDPGKNDFHDLAEPDSWALLSETASEAIYSFSPKPEDERDREVNQYLRGELTVNKHGPSVSAFELANTEPFKASIAKIETMHMRIDMQKVGNGAYAVWQMSNQIEGKALFKTISEQVELSYTNYAHVPEGACSQP